VYYISAGQDAGQNAGQNVPDFPFPIRPPHKRFCLVLQLFPSIMRLHVFVEVASCVIPNREQPHCGLMGLPFITDYSFITDNCTCYTIYY